MKPNEEQFEKFVKVLREMFMIDDAADLDFGIYKVMHQKQAGGYRKISESRPAEERSGRNSPKCRWTACFC